MRMWERNLMQFFMKSNSLSPCVFKSWFKPFPLSNGCNFSSQKINVMWWGLESLEPLWEFFVHLFLLWVTRSMMMMLIIPNNSKHSLRLNILFLSKFWHWNPFLGEVCCCCCHATCKFQRFEAGNSCQCYFNEQFLPWLKLSLNSVCIVWPISIVF